MISGGIEYKTTVSKEWLAVKALVSQIEKFPVKIEVFDELKKVIDTTGEKAAEYLRNQVRGKLNRLPRYYVFNGTVNRAMAGQYLKSCRYMGSSALKRTLTAGIFDDSGNWNPNQRGNKRPYWHMVEEGTSGYRASKKQIAAYIKILKETGRYKKGFSGGNGGWNPGSKPFRFLQRTQLYWQDLLNKGYRTVIMKAYRSILAKKKDKVTVIKKK